MQRPISCIALLLQNLLQWNVFNTDIKGAELSVHITEAPVLLGYRLNEYCFSFFFETKWPAGYKELSLQTLWLYLLDL